MWAICNVLIIFISGIYDMPLLYLVPMFSISLLYDDFLVSIKDFNDKKITKKMLFREYRKFQAITPSVVGIYFKICFGPLFISIIEFNSFSLEQILLNLLFLFGGLSIIISLFKDVIKFNK